MVLIEIELTEAEEKVLENAILKRLVKAKKKEDTFVVEKLEDILLKLARAKGEED